MSKWEQHITCTRLMRQHPDWSNQQVLEEARMHAMEMNIVEEARREVEAETPKPGNVRSERSY